MPERPWDSPFKAFPPNGAAPVSRPMLSCRYGNPFLPSLLRRRRKPGESIDSRALLPVRVRSHQAPRKMPGGPMPSWGCASLGCSPLRSAGPGPELKRTSDAALPPTGARRSTTTCAQKHYQPQGRMASLEAPDPSEVFDLFGKLSDMDCTGQSRMD
jgi:hypothetical protein